MHTILLSLDWKSLLFGSEDAGFLLEVLLRSSVMFLVVLAALRALGKRSVAQLSVFELGVIIGLGSAAGDPMFYKDVGLLPCLLVFGVVVALSRLLTAIINHSDKLEKTLEGTPTYLVEDGQLLYKNFKAEPVAQNELFSQLRMRGVSHLGQVKRALIESNGSISVYFFEDADVREGLPVLPHILDKPLPTLPAGGSYACTECSQTKQLPTGAPPVCDQCGKEKWVAVWTEKRIS